MVDYFLVKFRATHEHDASLYQFTAPSIRHFWAQRLGVSLVNSRAKVGMVAARRDWNTFARSCIASMAPARSMVAPGAEQL